MIVAVLLALTAVAQPRPVNAAEREAVAIAAAFLANGPEALYARLSPDAPLRALPKADALRVLIARTGPRDGATWTLQTVDSTSDAAFRVTWPNGGESGLLFRMKGRGLHELQTLAHATRGAPPAPTSAPPAPRGELRPALIALCVLCIVAGFLLRELRLTAIILFASGAALGVAGVLPWFQRTKVAAPPPRGPVVAGPHADLVLAREALAAGNEQGAAAAFERAAGIPPLRDDVLHEAAISLDDPRYYARMRALGTRDADAYYAEGTYESFRTAWMLEPKPREELVRDSDLAALMNDLRVKMLISFYSAKEPARRSASLAKNPLAWPADAKAFVCGERLRVEIGNAAIEIPNGAPLAPADAEVVPATHGEQRRDAIALREAEKLLEKRGAPSRTVLIRAVAALARHNRWPDVLMLTDGNMPPDLLPVRIRALLRAGRVDDARALAEGQQLDDPTAVLAVADAMSNAGQWSTAETLFRSVAGPQHATLVGIRLRQLELRRALATSSQVIATPHFDIRHDATINPAIASRIGDLLEAELARLQKKLPRVELRRVAVNVLRWEDFRGGITNSDHILGLYDGEILFPFAAVEQYKPEVVAIITHELAHAILAQATADNAPRWFQEGVATRMELVERQENVFSDTPAAVVLPVTLLDAVMERNADPSAYIVAQTFIRFLEDRYGANVIATLAAEFARGTNSDDALLKLAGKPLDALNADFREWGFHHNGDFVMNEPWPYRDLYSPGVDPRIRDAFKFRRD